MAVTRGSASTLRVVEGRAHDAWDAMWKSFERHLKADPKITSAKTIKTYGQGGKAFHAWLIRERIDTDPRKVTKAIIEDFIGDLRARAKTSTVHNRTVALRKFFSFLEEEGEIKINPAEKIRAPRAEEASPDVLNDEEIEALIAATDGKDFEDIRDRAILLLAIDTGMRRFEIAAMPVLGDAELDAGVYKFAGKGKYTRVVALNPDVVKAMDRYLRVRQTHLHADLDRMWIAQKGALSADGIHHLVRRRAIQAGIERSFGPHALRHTWAANVKAAGMSEEDIMTNGGWRDRKSMLRYGKSQAEARGIEAARKHSLASRFGRRTR